MQQQCQRNEAQKSFLQASNQSEVWVTSRSLFSSMCQPRVQKLPFANKSHFLQQRIYCITWWLYPQRSHVKQLKNKKHTDFKTLKLIE